VPWKLPTPLASGVDGLPCPCWALLVTAKADTLAVPELLRSEWVENGAEQICAGGVDVERLVLDGDTTRADGGTGVMALSMLKLLLCELGRELAVEPRVVDASLQSSSSGG
jgi:hypothetical protein